MREVICVVVRRNIGLRRRKWWNKR